MPSPNTYVGYEPSAEYIHNLNQALVSIFERAEPVRHRDATTFKGPVWRKGASLYNSVKASTDLGIIYRINRIVFQEDKTCEVRDYLLAVTLNYRLGVSNNIFTFEDAESLWGDEEKSRVADNYLTEEFRQGVYTPTELEYLDFLADAGSFREADEILRP